MRDDDDLRNLNLSHNTIAAIRLRVRVQSKFLWVQIRRARVLQHIKSNKIEDDFSSCFFLLRSVLTLEKYLTCNSETHHQGECESTPKYQRNISDVCDVRRTYSYDCDVESVHRPERGKVKISRIYISHLQSYRNISCIYVAPSDIFRHVRRWEVSGAHMRSRGRSRCCWEFARWMEGKVKQKQHRREIFDVVFVRLFNWIERYFFFLFLCRRYKTEPSSPGAFNITKILTHVL